MYHLAWFLGGFAPHGWTNRPYDWRRPDRWVDLAQELESAFFDFMIVEDSSWIHDSYGSSPDYYIRNASSVPKQDPAIVAPVLLDRTESIGIVPTLSTSEWQPYAVARAVGTMDQISGGRAGWNIVTGHSDLAPQNYGRPGLPPHDERYDRAAEFVDVVTGLWNTWEPDAIHDTPGMDFADPAKVHRLDHRGTYFASRGPLVSGPPTQKRPLLLQAGGSARGLAFAAKHADVVIASSSTPEEARTARETIRANARAIGRDPDTVKILFLVSPIVMETDAAAHAVLDAVRASTLADPTGALAAMSSTVDVDFAQFSPDAQVDAIAAQVSTNGNVSSLQNFLRLGAGLTLRELAAKVVWSRRVEFVGSPETVADQMADLMDATGGDGFLFSLPGARLEDLLPGITRGLVPELQRRGLMRKEYHHAHTRENVFAF